MGVRAAAGGLRAAGGAAGAGMVAERYVDDDVSAYSGKRGRSTSGCLATLRAGAIDGVVVYHLDRLHRQPKELEEFFEVCEAAGVDERGDCERRHRSWRPGWAVPGPYPRCGGEEGERRQEPPDSAQARGAGGERRRFRVAAAARIGYEADK